MNPVVTVADIDRVATVAGERPPVFRHGRWAG